MQICSSYACKMQICFSNVCQMQICFSNAEKCGCTKQITILPVTPTNKQTYWCHLIVTSSIVTTKAKQLSESKFRKATFGKQQKQSNFRKATFGKQQKQSNFRKATKAKQLSESNFLCGSDVSYSPLDRGLKRKRRTRQKGNGEKGKAKNAEKKRQR